MRLSQKLQELYVKTCFVGSPHADIVNNPPSDIHDSKVDLELCSTSFMHSELEIFNIEGNHLRYLNNITKRRRNNSLNWVM